MEEHEQGNQKVATSMEGPALRDCGFDWNFSHCLTTTTIPLITDMEPEVMQTLIRPRPVL